MPYVTLFAAVSDVVWQAIIAGIVTIILAYFQLRLKQSVDAATKATKDTAEEVAFEVQEVAVKAKVTAEEVSEVKETLAVVSEETSKRLDGLAGAAADLAKVTGAMAVVADKTHVLVNSKMGAQLALTAMLARRMAGMTQDPKDETAALNAESLLKEHVEKQAIVDAKEGKSGTKPR